MRKKLEDVPPAESVEFCWSALVGLMKSGSESPFKSAIVILHEMYGPKYAVCGFDHVPEALEVTYVTVSYTHLTLPTIVCV